MILDGRGIFRSGLTDGTYGRRLNDAARTRGRVAPPLTSIAEDAPALYARVQTADLGEGLVTHWVVDCECGSTVAVWLDTPLMLCVRCWNQAHRKRWRRVTLPDAETIAEIDRILSLRPVRHRWWTPDESLLDLMAQNVSNGQEI